MRASATGCSSITAWTTTCALMRDWAAAQGGRAGLAFAEGFRQHLGHSYPQDNLVCDVLGGIVARLIACCAPRYQTALAVDSSISGRIPSTSPFPIRGLCHESASCRRPGHVSCRMLTAGRGRASRDREDKKPQASEVVFCLDTTGSMGGLIEGAKQKIWSISNQIVAGKPSPNLKVGLLAFRDKGDVYITKMTDLTDDLDAIYSTIKTYKAEGGGDIPESVNQALNESVLKFKWSKEKDTLRIIFLVGDAPPHMDYKNDVRYPETCKVAVKKNIIINTVQCGNDAECTKFWQDISSQAGGAYVQIAQDGAPGPRVVTPQDKRLAEINAELENSTLVYGSKEKQAEGPGFSAEVAGWGQVRPGQGQAIRKGPAPGVKVEAPRGDLAAKPGTRGSRYGRWRWVRRWSR